MTDIVEQLKIIKKSLDSSNDRLNKCFRVIRTEFTQIKQNLKQNKEQIGKLVASLDYPIQENRETEHCEANAETPCEKCVKAPSDDSKQCRAMCIGTSQRCKRYHSGNGICSSHDPFKNIDDDCKVVNIKSIDIKCVNSTDLSTCVPNSSADEKFGRRNSYKVYASYEQPICINLTADDSSIIKLQIHYIIAGGFKVSGQTYTEDMKINMTNDWYMIMKLHKINKLNSYEFYVSENKAILNCISGKEIEIHIQENDIIKLQEMSKLLTR